MAFVDGFSYDVFVSYSHLDNKRGWVAEFHRFLEMRLAEVLGTAPKIWRDDTEISGTDYFDEHIFDKLKSSALFITIMSPSYVQSEWCMREYQAFLNHKNNDVRVGDKASILKVRKMPVKFEDHPEEVRNVLGYQFFELDNRNRAIELHPNVAEEPGYFTVLNDLAYDIGDLLKQIKSGVSESVPKRSVYLAETTSDLEKERDQIRRELLQQGYRVLPEQQLPTQGNKLIASVKNAIEECQLLIHIIGEDHSFIPEGETESSVEIQLREGAASKIKQLIWLPNRIIIDDIADLRQKRFVEALRHEPGEAELLQVPSELFKTSLFIELNREEEVVNDVISREKPSVYLVYDKKDESQVEPIYEYLFDEDIDVIRPLLTGESTERRLDHEDTLRTCDAVLIYRGAVRETWIRAKERDLRKIAGNGRNKPFSIKAMYLGDPESEQKIKFRSNLIDLVIKHFGPFVPAAMNDFVMTTRTGSIHS